MTELSCNTYRTKDQSSPHTERSLEVGGSKRVVYYDNRLLKQGENTVKYHEAKSMCIVYAVNNKQEQTKIGINVVLRKYVVIYKIKICIQY